jgi:ribonuclease BN (tRNA processing enzyme)
MSTFDGLIREFQTFGLKIIVDNFKRDDAGSLQTLSNLNLQDYAFLSHCHTDHLTGIDGSSLIIHTSQPNCDYLAIEYPCVKTRSLPFDVETVFKTVNGVDFSVTLIDANHCLGVLFFSLISRIMYVFI